MENFCCLFCGLQGLGVGSSLLVYATRNRISVSEIVEMKDFFVRSRLSQMKECVRNSILDLCISLVSTFGRNEALLFHEGFFLKKKYAIGARFGGTDLHFGEVACGEVLEILQDDSTSNIVTERLLDNMKKECALIGQVNQVSDKLTSFVLNKTIRISLQNNLLEVTLDSQVCQLIELQHCHGPYVCLFNELLLHLEKIESVSLIIVEYEPGAPLAREWMDFFSSIYGGLYLQLLVFVVTYDGKYTNIGPNSKEDVKNYLNFGMELDAVIKWLDMTTINETQPHVEHVNTFDLGYDDE